MSIFNRNDENNYVYDEAGGKVFVGFWHNLFFYGFMLILFGSPVAAIILWLLGWFK